MVSRVFVLGAGASKSCGIPLTNELLPSILPSIDRPSTLTLLLDFIKYLYPHFDPKWRNYPNLEELLSLLDVYIEFSEKVKKKHKFDVEEISDLKDEVLRAISIYLHESVSKVSIKKTHLYSLVS